MSIIVFRGVCAQALVPKNLGAKDKGSGNIWLIFSSPDPGGKSTRRMGMAWLTPWAGGLHLLRGVF